MFVWWAHWWITTNAQGATIAHEKLEICIIIWIKKYIIHSTNASSTWECVNMNFGLVCHGLEHSIIRLFYRRIDKVGFYPYLRFYNSIYTHSSLCWAGNTYSECTIVSPSIKINRFFYSIKYESTLHAQTCTHWNIQSKLCQNIHLHKIDNNNNNNEKEWVKCSSVKWKLDTNFDSYLFSFFFSRINCVELCFLFFSEFVLGIRCRPVQLLKIPSRNTYTLHRLIYRSTAMKNRNKLIQNICKMEKK